MKDFILFYFFTETSLNNLLKKEVGGEGEQFRENVGVGGVLEMGEGTVPCSCGV